MRFDGRTGRRCSARERWTTLRLRRNARLSMCRLLPHFLSPSPSRTCSSLPPSRDDFMSCVYCIRETHVAAVRSAHRIGTLACETSCTITQSIHDYIAARRIFHSPRYYCYCALLRRRRRLQLLLSRAMQRRAFPLHCAGDRVRN